jgi:hypothetical protein
LVQGCKMGSKEWIWKNKSSWKLFLIYTVVFIYGRFSKTFHIFWKNPKKIGEYSLRCEGNDNKRSFFFPNEILDHSG